MSDDYYMQEALKEAKKAFEKDEVPIGVVIVSKNIIIARTHNLTEQLNDATAHAEMQALTSASAWLGSKYLLDCTLYVTIEPCLMCASASYWSQISRLVYAASDPKRGYTLFNPSCLHPKTEVCKGLLSDQASELITKFFQSKR